MENKLLYCAECGHEVQHDKAVYCEHHVFCSMQCYGSCVGFTYVENKGYICIDDLM